MHGAEADREADRDVRAIRRAPRAKAQVRSRQRPDGRNAGNQARAERPRSELAGNPGLELFFFFEPARDGFGFAPIAVLADSHTVHACVTGAR